MVFTIGRADQVELPGATTSPWQATKWFCGKETFESFMLDDDRRKGQLDAALPVQLFREHDKLTREVLELRLDAGNGHRSAEEASSEPERAAHQSRAASLDRNV